MFLLIKFINWIKPIIIIFIKYDHFGKHSLTWWKESSRLINLFNFDVYFQTKNRKPKSIISSIVRMIKKMDSNKQTGQAYIGSNIIKNENIIVPNRIFVPNESFHNGWQVVVLPTIIVRNIKAFSSYKPI